MSHCTRTSSPAELNGGRLNWFTYNRLFKNFVCMNDRDDSVACPNSRYLVGEVVGARGASLGGPYGAVVKALCRRR